MNAQSERNDPVLSEDAVVTMSLSSKKAASSAKTKRNRRSRWFLIALCLYFVLLMAAVGYGLFRLYASLAHYQEATPTAVLDQYIRWVENNDYEAIYDSSGFEETLLNPKKAYLQYLERIYGGDPDEITLQETLSADPDRRYYTVCFDGEPVNRILLTGSASDWKVTTEIIGEPSYTIYAGAEMRLTLNGDDVTLLGLDFEEIQNTLFAGTETTGIYPSVLRYTIDGLLNPPVIEALTLDGSSCAVTADERDPHVLYVTPVTTDDEKTRLEEQAATVATTYAAFIARDAKRAEVLSYLIEDTDFYKTVKKYDNSKFDRHTAYEFQDLQVLNFSRITEDDFTCDVKIQPVYTYKKKTFNGDPIHYRLTFLKIEDEWLLLSLETVTQEPTSSENTDTTQTEESP